MAAKTQRTGARSGAPAGEIFRQFAWNIAGALVRPETRQKPRPQRQKPVAR